MIYKNKEEMIKKLEDEKNDALTIHYLLKNQEVMKKHYMKEN